MLAFTSHPTNHLKLIFSSRIICYTFWLLHLHSESLQLKPDILLPSCNSLWINKPVSSLTFSVSSLHLSVQQQAIERHFKKKVEHDFQVWHLATNCRKIQKCQDCHFETWQLSVLNARRSIQVSLDVMTCFGGSGFSQLMPNNTEKWSDHKCS